MHSGFLVRVGMTFQTISQGYEGVTFVVFSPEYVRHSRRWSYREPWTNILAD